MLREEDLKLLWSFVLRIGMYVGVESEERISSFLHGYDAGTLGKCDFLKQLSDSIEKDYKISSMATGWIGQIYRVADKIQSDWVTVFKRQSIKILAQKINEYAVGSELKEVYIQRIIGLLNRSDRVFDFEWRTDWETYLDLNAGWASNIWADSEILILQNLNQELKSFKENGLNQNRVDKSPKFEELKLKLIDKVKTRANNS